MLSANGRPRNLPRTRVRLLAPVGDMLVHPTASPPATHLDQGTTGFVATNTAPAGSCGSDRWTWDWAIQADTIRFPDMGETADDNQPVGYAVLMG